MVRALAARVVLVTTLAFAALPLPALGSGEVDRGLAGVASAAQTYDTAERALAASRATQDELAHRITALKRLRGDARGRLSELLEQSVVAERDMAARTAARDRARAEVEQRVGRTVQLIDDEIRALRPGLKGPNAPEVARRLKALLADREAARGALARLSSGAAPAPQAWSQYEVKVDPLDGPADLREKADFVEDTRDKLRKKREALERLVSDARQAREIARASVNFRTEVGLFDEQSRSGRVAKTGDGSGAVATVADERVTTTDGPGKANVAPAPQEPPAAALGPEPAPTGAARGSEDSFSGAAPVPPTIVGSISGGSAAPTASPAAPALPRSVDAAGLLNLDVRALGTGRDVASLESLLRDLATLDQLLDARASQIRRRAQALEADEAKVLGQPSR